MPPARCCFNPYTGATYWDPYCSRGTHDYAKEGVCGYKPFGGKKSRKNRKSRKSRNTRRRS